MIAIPVPHTARAAIFIIAAGLLLNPGGVRAESRTYEIDPAHFFVSFLVDQGGFGKVVGSFLRGEGRFVYDEQTRTVQSGSVAIYSKSVFTGHGQRDRAIRGPRFLDADEHPDIVFEASAHDPGGDDGEGELSGQLTILEETNPITLDFAVNRVGEARPDELPGESAYILGASARATVSRSEWGMTEDTDDHRVGDEVDVIIEFRAERQPE